MFLTVKPYLHLTELFEIELFFDIETVFTLNRIVIYSTVLTSNYV